MLKIGLTGGIGSGKTTVAKVFETLGIPVYYADDAAKELMHTDEDLKQQIIRHFGSETYENGTLNRQYLSQKVFNNAEQLQLLNSLVHPATIKDAQNWMLKQTTPYSIKEAALIFESGSEKNLDYVIGVHAPATLRIQRVMQRDGITKEEVLQRIGKQMNEEDKMELCNFVIENDEQHLLIPQVMALHEQLLLLAQ
ncbi:MAG: dephospho-CoA kinase [Chitinophagaceae bacterium]|nr:dephospho-CoA kinase [Chitinophagaceae bacterium]